MRIKDLADPSETVMFVEADEDRSVIWTRPDDLEFDMDHPRRGLGGFRSDGILVGLCDGPVRTLKPAISEKTLRALFTVDKRGEVIDSKDY